MSDAPWRGVYYSDRASGLRESLGKSSQRRMVTYGGGKPCSLQGDLHQKAIRLQVDTRSICSATSKLDR